ncbi:hypothetical protein POTOM_029847 [Populus tomentosa]|uniref:DNA glycosylase superfamily protein n=1 Tax=Populus tomentosa TaxID=118781 RepID=A0A8X7ZM23_POPTO|nr:hypothetical protein POTOM_029847 [Populus tomentosa]
MSKANVRKQILEKNSIFIKEKEKPLSSQGLFTKHLKRVYPIGLHRSSSSLSLSSVSLSLSQSSNDSSLTDCSATPLEQKISLALRLISPSERREALILRFGADKVYVAFHDEFWGVPVYDDIQLFELLALSGMLMDYNWTEILKRKELFREAFDGFNPNIVARMGEKEIMEIASNKAIMLAESRIAREFGSFSNYVWGNVNFKPTINRYKYPRNVQLRSPKAEAISKDLLKRGFRFVGPVIVYSFMQAAGLTIDHLVDCYRYGECVSLAERPRRHI